MCNILELSGLFVCLGRLDKFSGTWGREKIAGLWFARGEISTQPDTMDHLYQMKHSKTYSKHPAGIYLLKVNNRNTRTSCEIC